MTKTKTYTGISRAKLDALRTALTAQGICPPPGDAGSCSAGYGFTLAWRYSPLQLRLDVALDGNFLLMDKAWGIVDSAVAKLG